jgi:hypothetical protein
MVRLLDGGLTALSASASASAARTDLQYHDRESCEIAKIGDSLSRLEQFELLFARYDNAPGHWLTRQNLSSLNRLGLNLLRSLTKAIICWHICHFFHWTNFMHSPLRTLSFCGHQHADFSMEQARSVWGLGDQEPHASLATCLQLAGSEFVANARWRCTGCPLMTIVYNGARGTTHGL